MELEKKNAQLMNDGEAQAMSIIQEKQRAIQLTDELEFFFG